MVRKHHGKVKESEASCENGSFQCKGYAPWCAKQEKVLCKAPEHEELADQSDADADAEDVAAQALRDAKLDDDREPAFLQHRPRAIGRLQA